MDKAQLLQNAINFAKQNPDSSQAVELRKRIESGMYTDELNQLRGVGTAPKKEPGLLSKIGNALVSSEVAVGNDLTAGVRAGMESNNEDLLRNAQNNTEKVLQDHINSLKAVGKDSTHAEQALATIKATSIAPKTGDFQKNVPESTKTNLQGLGDVGGVALDTLSGGTYGAATKAAEAGKLLVKGGGVVENLAAKAAIPTTEKILTPVVKDVAEKTLVGTLKTIGKKTLARAAAGGVTGYAYDVTQNLKNGETGADILTPGAGTVLGGSVPTLFGVIEAGGAVTKSLAPKLINGLIKPKMADFSYGKNPGRTVSEMGITGNSIDDFANNINTAKKEVGQQLGDIYSNPANANITIDATEELKKIDDAIAKASKGGKENQGIVTTLQNTKDALLYEHAVNADGVIEKVGTTPRDLSALNPQEAFDLKKVISDQTKFTGKPSDDKTVNTVLQNMYGGLKKKLNTSLAVNNPEIEKLNQQFADLTSAELATRNRAAILGRQNMIGLGTKVTGSSVGLATALATGGVGVPAVLAAIGAGATEKALESTAVRTRMAKWIGSATPSMISKIPPEVKTVLIRVLPKFASQLGD